ncbi:MAG: GWxTD domain-containing protein [Chlorobi bacterium]|nr:GWxTD domain-containing protein [Chlorobiota bacterium]MCI0714944.1 GWxTD domain-containing protein [Chlorobiota bacterium]
MRTIITSLLLALLVQPSVSQKEIKTKLFNLDVLNFYSTEGTKSRVDVYVEVPFSNLEFKRSKEDKSVYSSKFDLNIEVNDENGSQVYSNVSKEEVKSKEAGTQYLAQNSQILTRNLFLPPGDYTVKVSIYEQNTKKTSNEERSVKVEDYITHPLSISDVMIVSRLTEKDGKTMITPDVSRNVGNIDTFYLFYYVYKNNDDEKVSVSCKITDKDNKEVFSSSETIDIFSGMDFQNQVFNPISTANFAFGTYTVEITAASKNYNTSIKSSFENQSYDFPLPMKDIDLLIDQLQYIAKDDEISYMRDGKTDAEKQKRFIDFWKKKDPTPLTKRNEVMYEYYRRLKIADERFSTSYVKGWKTDMGMVFIIFGQPDNIDRHPYEMDTKPYEIWDYYNLNRQFLFVDNSGFGDYRLVTPIWDTRFRLNY